MSHAAAGPRLHDRLAGAGIWLRSGPFVFHVRSSIPVVTEGVELLYGDHRMTDHEDFADFHIAIHPPAGLRRWIRPQALFTFDGFMPFTPLPLDQALPFFEWGLNWVISQHANDYLTIHAAAIERGGRVAVLPGVPGAGKSTLTAALVHRGWRLLTDELTMVSMRDGGIVPLARPVSLKNESIEIIRKFAGATFSRPTHDTAKGTVALMRPPPESVARIAEAAPAAWVIFPRFEKGAPAILAPRGKAATFLDLANNSFNYNVHGRRGFDAIAALMDSCACYDFSYGDLDEAVTVFAELSGGS